MWLLLLRWLNSVGVVGSLWLVYLVLITGVRRCIWYCFVCGVFVVLRLVASLLLGLFWWWRLGCCVCLVGVYLLGLTVNSVGYGYS